MPSSGRPPTIQDVARQANVSAATVSRVLSAPERVAETTRERVQQAVRQTGYAVNQAARTLRQQRARTLLTAMPGLGNMFYSNILEAVVQTATSRGYGVLVTSQLGDDPTRWLADYLRSNRADGLLLFDGTLDTRRLHDFARNDGAVRLVAAYDELPDPQINSVITDNFQAAERAVRHLIDLGHRRIGHVTGMSRNASPNERLLGFRQAMLDHGLEIRDEWIIPGTYFLSAGINAAKVLMSLTEMPTALFVANDEMAIGLITELRKNGIECPRDISVVGFDDTVVSEAFFPALTTMRQPREEIGRIATETLINLLEGNSPDDDPVRIVLRSELVVRDSTRPLGSG